MKSIIALMGLTACVSLPHVDPHSRSEGQGAAASVRIHSTCSEADGGDGIGWGDDYASGVVISERHVLTALHVVDCPTFPVVHAAFSNGRVLRMAVVREDREHDLAELELDSADHIGLGIAPPALGYAAYGSRACVALAWGTNGLACGHFIGSNEIDIGTPRGTSGAGVYSADGLLMGLVVRGNSDFTVFSPVGGDWLSGT